jgi:uncharacterized protein (DUF302 family)
MRMHVRHVVAILWLLGTSLPLGMAGVGAASAAELFTRSKTGSFDDIKFDLTNAVIERGLVVDYTGSVAGMLERTGADVGSTKKLYRQAEYFIFCSAKLSREMMEADPANIGFCPFVVFIYERSDKPGEIVVGARPPTVRGDDASRKALAEVEALLHGIVSDAVK